MTFFPPQPIIPPQQLYQAPVGFSVGPTQQPGMPPLPASPFQPPNIPQINLQPNQPPLFQPIPTLNNPQGPISYNSAASGITNPPIITSNPNPNPNSTFQQQSYAQQQPVLSNILTGKKEKYGWAKRSEKMKWELAASIDVPQLVRTGDIESVLFYMQQFVNANVTNEDAKKYFKGPAGVNAYLILQLATDYLLKQVQISEQKYNELVSKYNEMSQTANEIIDSRTAKVKQLTAQIEREQKQYKAFFEKSKAKIQALKGHKKSHKKADRNPIPKPSHDADTFEGGQIRDETDQQVLQMLHQNLLSSGEIKHSKKPAKKNDSDDDSFALISDSHSQGEIRTSELGNNIDTFAENIEEEEEYDFDPGSNHSEGEASEYSDDQDSNIDDDDFGSTHEEDDY